MTIRMTIIASTALLALGACGKSPDNPAANTAATGQPGETGVAPAPSASVAMSPAQSFANAAAASDAFEIATSRLALSQSTSTSVKAFAQKMIEAHTASTEKLKTAAAAVTPTVAPDPALDAQQQQKLDQLRGLTGQAFDQAYIAEQTAGHQQTLDMLKAYAATGDAPSLKSFAAGLVPTVTAHLNMAKGLKA